MKKFIYLICLLSFFVNSYSEIIRNNKGQKMVTCIESFVGNSTKASIVIEFDYKAKVLDKMVFNSNTENLVVFVYNDQLCKKVYDINYKLRVDYQYKYKFVDNIILEKSETIINNNGTKSVFVETYKYDGDNRIIDYYKNDFFTKNGSNKLIHCSYVDRIKYQWKNGNVYSSSLYAYNSDKEDDFPDIKINTNRSYIEDLKNDTNIDFWTLLLGCMNGKNIEFCTEWGGEHSTNLIKEDYYKFEYVVEENGNDKTIREIKVYMLGRLYEVYKIHYAEI